MRPDGRLFENAPNRCAKYRHFDFCTDERGLRRSKVTPSKSAGTPILFLGDSVTLGWGVDDEQTWVRGLEEALETSTGDPVVCLNAGHLQYDTIQELDWLRAHGAQIAPSRIVLTFVSNDLDDTWQTYQDLMADAARAPTAQDRVRGWASRYLPGLFGVWIHHEVVHGTEPADSDAHLPVHERQQYVERWPVSERALDQLLATAQELTAELVILDHTVPPFPDLPEWCAANGFVYGDFRFTPEESAQNVRLSAADAHANARGHAFLTDKAAQALTRSGELRRRVPHSEKQP